MPPRVVVLDLPSGLLVVTPEPPPRIIEPPFVPVLFAFEHPTRVAEITMAPAHAKQATLNMCWRTAITPLDEVLVPDARRSKPERASAHLTSAST